jgi:ABC-type Zn uptake system ZnuABC Zn-binding protein ZnuA
MPEETRPYEGWAIVELMGHRRLAGLVSQAEQYGVAMLRLDVPATEGAQAATQFYGGSSIYCITPVSEDLARRVAERTAPAPVHTWELPPSAHPRSYEETVEDAEEAVLADLGVEDEEARDA